MSVHRTAAEWRDVIAALRSEAGAAMREAAAKVCDERQQHCAQTAEFWAAGSEISPAEPQMALNALQRAAEVQGIAAAIRPLPLQPEGGENHGR